jgi:hypothetical protein
LFSHLRHDPSVSCDRTLYFIFTLPPRSNLLPKQCRMC